MSVSSRHSRNNLLLGQDSNALTWLIIINAVFFVLLGFIKIVYFFSDIPVDQYQSQVVNWFSLPADTSVALTRPWTLLTHMFTHTGIWHLLSNMLWLWAFGYILQDLAGNRILVPIYLYGGIIGATFFLLTANFLPSLETSPAAIRPLLGAGAPVMALAVAATALSPNYKIFPMLGGGISLWIVALVFVLIHFGTMSSANTETGVAHIFAGLAGFVFVRQLRRGRDMGAWMHRTVAWTDDLFNPEKKHPQNRSRQHFYKAKQPAYSKKPHLTQQRLDEILDKINQKGYDKLSEEEKEFLKKLSNENI